MQFKFQDTASQYLSVTTQEEISEHIQNLIEKYSIEKYPAEHRNHLGASIISAPCSRQSWYTFRWVKLIQHGGRIRRLFARGHREEQKFIEILRGIGLTVWELDPDTQKQFRIYGCQKHYGGSADGKGLLPWFPDMPILTEYKTHNTKSFLKLKNEKLKISHPKHYGQMCAYGRHFKMRYGLYFAENKNDDDIHTELVELDWNLGHQLENKALDIVQARTPPARISDSPAFFECKFCDFVDICHHGEAVEINCRSCKFAQPVEEGEWNCTRFNGIIPKEFLKKGCDAHLSVNE